MYVRCREAELRTRPSSWCRAAVFFAFGTSSSVALLLPDPREIPGAHGRSQSEGRWEGAVSDHLHHRDRHFGKLPSVSGCGRRTTQTPQQKRCLPLERPFFSTDESGLVPRVGRAMCSVG